MAPRFWKNRHIHDLREIKTKEDKKKVSFRPFCLVGTRKRILNLSFIQKFLDKREIGLKLDVT